MTMESVSIEHGIHFSASACGAMDSLMCNCTSEFVLRTPRNDGERIYRQIIFSTYAGPLGMSENRVSQATGPMLAAMISKAASAPSSKLPRLAN
jgi:hypothetical protein